MNTIDSNHKSLIPYLALGGVCATLMLPAWFRFRAAKVPFFSFNRLAVPLQISTLGLVAASGGMAYARRKRIVYEESLLFTRWSIWKKGDNWYDELEGYNIILGAIPLADLGHVEKLKDKICAVLTCLERFEQEKGWFNTPVTGMQWQEAEKTWKGVEAADFLPMTPEQIGEAVEFLQEHTKNGAVYVHCKAGRGRSATAVIAYLMKEKEMSLDAAYKFVKGKRRQIHLNARQWAALVQYAQSLAKG